MKNVIFLYSSSRNIRKIFSQIKKLKNPAKLGEAEKF